MAKTKTNWHELSADDLKAKLTELSEERFRLRFRSATESIENPMLFRHLRRDIAHLYPDSTMLDDVDDEQLGTLYWDAQNELGLYPEVEGMGIYFPKREWKGIINFVVDNLRK